MTDPQRPLEYDTRPPGAKTPFARVLVTPIVVLAAAGLVSYATQNLTFVAIGAVVSIAYIVVASMRG